MAVKAVGRGSLNNFKQSTDQSDVGLEELTTDEINKNLQNISRNVQQMKNLAESLGTSKDFKDIQHQLKTTQNETNQLIKQTRNLLRQLQEERPEHKSKDTGVDKSGSFVKNRDQLKIQPLQEPVDFDLIKLREQDLNHLEQDVGSVCEIFEQLCTLMDEEELTGANVEAEHENKPPVLDLKPAKLYLARRRRRKCILLVVPVCLIVVVVVVVIIVTQT